MQMQHVVFDVDVLLVIATVGFCLETLCVPVSWYAKIMIIQDYRKCKQSIMCAHCAVCTVEPVRAPTSIEPALSHSNRVLDYDK